MYEHSLTSLWWQKTSFHKIPNLSGNNRTCGYQEFVHYYRQALDYVSELDAEQIRQKMSWLENMLLWYNPWADHDLNTDYEFMALKDIVVLRQFFDENKGNIDCHSEACPHLICVHALFDAIAYCAWYSEDDEWDDFLFDEAPGNTL